MSLNKALTEEYENEVSLPFVLQHDGSPHRAGDIREQERVATEASLNQSWIGSGVVYADYYTLTNGSETILNERKNDHGLKGYGPVLYDSDDEDEEIEDDDFFEVEDDFESATNESFVGFSGKEDAMNTSRGPNAQATFLASLISDPIGSSSAALQDIESCEHASEVFNNLRDNKFECASHTLEECCKVYMNRAKDVMFVDQNLARDLALVSRSYAQRAQAIRLSAHLRDQTSHDDNDEDTTAGSPPRTITLAGSSAISNKGNGATSSPDRRTQGGHSKMSSIRDVVRNALHATHEEDMTESVFLGSVAGTATKSESSRPKSSSTANTPKPPSSPVRDAMRHEVNPIDDMLRLEKELQMMDNSLSMQNSIANLASCSNNKIDDSSSFMSSSILYTPKTPSRIGALSYSSMNFVPPPNQHGLDSSWLGQSSTISKASSGTESTNSYHIPVDYPGRLWSTSSFVQTPRSPSHPMTGATTNPSSDQAESKKSQHPGESASKHAALPSKAVPPTNTKQILRLLDSLKTLGDENAALLKQVEEAQHARVEAAAVRKEMKIFQRKYQERFRSLKSSLEDIYKKEARDSDHSTSLAGGKGKNGILNSKFLHRDEEDKKSGGALQGTARQQIKSMEAQIKLLSQQLTKLQEELKKKESQMKKYETFYKEVKARSAQRAAERQSASGKGAQ